MNQCLCFPCECRGGWDCRNTGIVEPHPGCPHHHDLWALFRGTLDEPDRTAVFVPRITVHGIEWVRS